MSEYGEEKREQSREGGRGGEEMGGLESVSNRQSVRRVVSLCMQVLKTVEVSWEETFGERFGGRKRAPWEGVAPMAQPQQDRRASRRRRTVAS